MSCFGGSTPAENQLQAASANFSELLMSNYEAAFPQQLQALQDLQAQVGKVESGNIGPGFSGQENNALISQIQNTGAANARNVEQASTNQVAGQNFNGDQNTSGLATRTGVRQQLNQQAESQASSNTANALTGELAANYAQGRANEGETISGLGALASGFGNASNASSSGGINANNTSFGQANTIYQQDDQGGLIGGLLETGLGFGLNALSRKNSEGVPLEDVYE